MSRQNLIIIEKPTSNHSAMTGMTPEQIECYVRMGIAACNCEQIISTRPFAIYEPSGWGKDDDGEFTASAKSKAGALCEGVTVEEVLLTVYEEDCMPARAAATGAMEGALLEPRLQRPASVGNIRFGAGVPVRHLITAAERQAEHEQTPEYQAARIGRGQKMLGAMRNQAAMAEAVELLNIWKTWLGPDYESCDEGGRQLWIRIESVLAQARQGELAETEQRNEMMDDLAAEVIEHGEGFVVAWSKPMAAGMKLYTHPQPRRAGREN